MSVHRVYWTEGDEPKSHTLYDLVESLKFSESLRKRKANGEDVGFITTASEIDGDVGLKGVDVTGPDYDWKKRRK